MATTLIEVNLLPIEFRVVRKDYSYLADRRVVWGSVALLVAIFAAWMHFMALVATATAKESSIQDLKDEIAKYDTVKTQITQFQELKSQQEEKNNSLRSISVSKKRWVRILEDINASLPPHTWLVSLKEDPSAPDQIVIVARTYVFQEVAGFMLQLERRPYFDVPRLEVIEQAKGEGADGTPSFAFTLHCSLSSSIHSDSSSAGFAGGQNGNEP
jgi:type IV pilus assembly protein PilN